MGVGVFVGCIIFIAFRGRGEQSEELNKPDKLMLPGKLSKIEKRIWFEL